MISNYNNFLYLSSLSLIHSFNYSTINNSNNSNDIISTNNTNDTIITNNNTNDTTITTTNNSTTTNNILINNITDTSSTCNSDNNNSTNFSENVSSYNKDKFIEYLLKNNIEFIDKNLIEKMNIEFACIINIIEIISSDLTIHEMNAFLEKININIESIGISKTEFKKIIRNIIKEYKNGIKTESIKVQNNFQNLKNIIDGKDIILSDKYSNKLLKFFYILNLLEDLNYINEKTCVNIILEFHNGIISILKNKSYKKDGKDKVCTKGYYKAEIQKLIDGFLLNITEKFSNFIDNLVGKNLINLRRSLNEIGIEFEKIYNNSIDKIISESTVLSYNRPSTINIKESKKSLEKEIRNKFSINSLELIKNINQISDLKIALADKKESRLDFDSPLTQILSEVINSGIKDNYVKQIMLEQKLLEYNEEWFKANIEKSTDVHSVLLHDIYNKLNKGLNIITHKYKMNNYRLLKNSLNNTEKNLDILPILVIFYLGNDQIINIMFKTLVEILGSSGGVGRNTLGIEIGRTLKNKALFTKKASLEGLDGFNFKDLIKNMSDEDLSHLGDGLISLILKYTNVLNIKLIEENNKKSNLISIKSEYISKLGVSCISLTKLPMLSPPNEPDNEGNYSPYLNPEIYHYYNPVNTIIKQKFDNIYPTSNLGVLGNIIKKLNKTEFIINKQVLNLLINEWSNEKSVIFNGYNVLKTVKENATKNEILDAQAHNSIYWNLLNTLRIAELYQNTSFYLPTFADFRGRIYSLSTYLSYQGGDLARGLLNFANAEEISEDGINYLALYLANVGGKSKLSKNDKINWAISNTIEIMENFNKGWDFLLNEYFKKGDEPIQYISCVLAMGEALAAYVNEQPLVVRTPILFDASCNGMQHLAALTREIDLATNVNLIKESDFSENDTPYDFYQIAGNLIEQEIANLKDIQFDKLKGIKIDRKLVKKPIMTIPYNISLNGMSDQLIEYIPLTWENKKPIYTVPSEFSKNNVSIYLTGKEFGKFAAIVYKTLTEKIPSIKFITNYLNSIIYILLKLDQPITWITPIGLKINLSTRTFKKVRTTAKLIENSKPVTISLPTNSLDKNAIKRAFMPNLIHSMDATNIHLLSNYLGDEPIYTIHDCFASSPNNMKNLENFVKEALIEMYFGEISYLERMHLNLLEQIQSYTPIYNMNNEIEQKLNPTSQYYVLLDDEKFNLPLLPETFYSKELRKRFIEGIRKSIFLIS